MSYTKPRYSMVPWLLDGDLEEGRSCMWEVEYKRDADVASCWRVDTFDKEAPTVFLVLHAKRGNGNDGGEIKLAISDTPRFDVYAKESFALMQVQSNPKRVDDPTDQ